MKIAVIPARAGSKRILRKNIKEFNGRPMIGWAINAALASNLFDRIIVSTDDSEIAEISKSFGAEAPFMRPPELADDITPTAPVIKHAIGYFDGIGSAVEYVCCIYPCTPFLRGGDLVSAFEQMINEGADFIYPVAEYSHPIQRAMIKNGVKMNFLNPEHELSRTQDLQVTYYDVGQFYWGRSSAWLSEKKMHSDGTGFIVPGWRFVDIDNLNDWERAQVMMKCYESMKSV